MRARIQREWLQKHPTPRAADGDFHWYPGAADADLRAELAGTDAELTLWLAPGRIVVARRFAAHAPGDGRRYVGLAVVIADAPHASVAALLAAVVAPSPAPWDGDAVHADVAITEPAERAPGGAASADLVAALWRGGRCGVALDACAAVETWLPAAIRASHRRLALESDASVAPPPALADVAAWIGAAVATRGAALERARKAWRAVAGLAAIEDRPIEAMFAELAAVERAWATAPSLRAHLAVVGIPLAARFHLDGDGAAQWARALHAWGRAGAPADRGRIAHLLARRAVADLLAGADAHRWRATLRWESLLPAARADELERATAALLGEVARG